MVAGDGRVKKLASQRGTDDIPGIVKDLKAAPQDGKEQIAHLLDILATANEANPSAIVRAGGIKLLVDMLSSGTDGGQLHAASTLATIAASKKEFILATVDAGVIGPLVGLLRKGSNKAQVYAAAAVASISQDPEHKDAMIQAGAIQPLVRLVRSDVAFDGQVYASDAIANLSHQNHKAQSAIHAAGAIPLLLKLLESGKAQISAANALGMVMSPGPEPNDSPPDLTPANAETQQAVAAGGAIPPLLSLLNGMNVLGQVHAASALSNIARENEANQNQIVAAGGIPTLLELLSSRSPEAQAQGASALAQIARFNRENQGKIANAGALPQLVALLISNLDFNVQAMAALAVTELCRNNDENKTNAAENGAISLLIEQLKDGQKARQDIVQAEAAGAIWVLSENHEANKLAVEGKRGIAPTVNLLASNNIRAQKHAANALASLGHDNSENQTQITELLVNLLGTGNPHAKSNAATTLWRIVQENSESQQKIAKAGPTSELISLLKVGTDQAKEYALWALSLSINEGNQSVLLDEDGIEPLVAALTAPLTITKQQAAAALASLALDNSKAQVAIAKAGSIRPLIKIVKETRGGEPEAIAAREQAAAALAQLAIVPGNRDEVVEAGGIDPLVEQVQTGEPMSQKFAAAAIARLAKGNQLNQTTIADAGAIPSLVQLLGGERGEPAQEEAAGALFELADDADNRISITKAKGIEPVVQLLGASNPKARRHAEGALVRLSIESANRVIIINKLVGMLRQTSNAAQEQAAAALANLASDSAENRNSIVDAGGIVPLITLFESSSAKAKENAVAAIAKLAHKSEGIQAAIASAGGIPKLGNVLIQSSANVKDLTAAQLCSIAASAVSALAEGNKANAVAIADAGAVTPLVGMLASPSPELQSNSAGALAQLSHLSFENQAAVARTGAIAPLCTLVREGTDQVRVQSAAALWALTYENAANKATVAKLGGIEPLVALLVSGSSQSSQSAPPAQASAATANECFEQSVGAIISLCAKHAENREAIAKLILARLTSRVAMVTTQGGGVRVLCAINRLCTNSSSNQLAFAKSGCVPLVISWLSGSLDSGSSVNLDAQCEAAHALLALAAGNEALQGLIVRSNGIPPLIELVSSNNLNTQGAAVRTLWHLASNSENGKLISESGAIQPLSSMLSSSEETAQELSAIVISRLLKTHPSVSQIVAKVGGVIPLARLLKSGSNTAQQQAVCAIAEVGRHPANRSKIADAGAIPALTALLTSDVLGTPETAARALANLARDGESTPDDGGSSVQDGQDSGGEESKGAYRRNEIHRVGAIKKLIGMLTSVSLSGAVTAKKMWDLVAKVIGVNTEEDGAGRKDAKNDSAEAKNRTTLEKVIGMQEQAAATLSDLAYGDVNMQNAMIDDDCVNPLINCLRNGSKLSQEHAARAIWHLCADMSNQGHIVHCGAVAELVALSRIGSARAQELSAAVISDLAKGAIQEREQRLKEKEALLGPMETEEKVAKATGNGDDGNEQGGDAGQKGEDEEDEEPDGALQGDRLSAIAAAGGVIPLVGLVTNGNQMGKERAASALLHLSVDSVNQQQIAKAGGIPPLVNLLDDGTEQAHAHAVAALARLAHENPENQSQIAKKLVSLLSNPREGAPQRAAHVLWQLAETNYGAPNRIVNAGAISPLVALLGSGTMEAKEEAVGALTCLAHNNSANQLAIARGLVGLLGSGSAEAQEQVTQMLIKFAQHPENRMAIAKSGALQRLVLQLRGKEGESSLKAQELAAAALATLAGDSEDNATQIASHGGIKPLVSLLMSESHEAQARAACALAYVTRSSKEIQESVAKEGAIEYLTNLLQSSDDEPTGASFEGRHEAAFALWSLSSKNKEIAASIAETGAIKSLVKLLHEEDSAAQQKAAGALSSLADGSRENQDAISQAGGTMPLVKLLDPEHEAVHVRAAHALAELVRSYPANQTAVAKAGGIKLLVALVKGDGAEEAKAAAATALWSLCDKHGENQQLVAKFDGLSPLCSLIGMGDSSTQYEAAGALAAIALENAANQHKIATMLSDLLQSEDLQICTKASLAVSRLARSHPSNQVAIAKVGGIKPLVGMVSIDASPAASAAASKQAAQGSEEAVTEKVPADVAAAERAAVNIRVNLQKEAASALWSMAHEYDANQKAIAVEGGISPLIALLSSSRAEVHRDAAGALWSLAASQDNQKLIAECKGITPLVALLTDGSHGAQETAAGALHSLAALPANRVEIAEAGGVPALTALFETSTEAAKTEAADALSSMVVENPDNQSSVARSLVGLLHENASSPQAKENACELVYKLSLDPENRGALSKWQAIEKLALQLRDGTAASQQNAAAALSQIALKSPQHRVQVTAQMIILLRSSEIDVRQRAFAALQDMAEEGGSDSRMTVKMAGGIDRFVAIMKDGSLEAQEYALWLLWQSTDMSSKKAIATARSAVPIIVILNSDKLSQLAKEHAATVLAGMTSADLVSVDETARATNKADIIEGGGIMPLVKLLKTGVKGAKKYAALTLAQLCRSAEGATNETQNAIAGVGAIPALVEWLDHPNLGPPPMAARALAELSSENEETQNTIAKAGAIVPLVAMLINGSVEEQRWAASAIAELAAANVSSQEVITEKGGIPPLVELLKHESKAATHENATRALWHLSSTRDNQLNIAIEGCLPPLVANLSHDAARAKWAAAACRSLTNECFENQLGFAQVGAILPLVTLLGSDNEETQLYAQGAVLNIALPAQNRGAAVKPLVELLKVRNAAAQMKSADTLAILAARSPENRAVIAQAGAVPPLVQLLGDGRNISVSQMRAAAALGNLAKLGESKQSIVAAGGVEPLVAMLLSANVEAQTRAAIAVCQLAASTSAQQLIADANGIQHLVKLLSSPHAVAATNAAGALWHLENLATTKGVIVAAGGIAALVELLGRVIDSETGEGQEATAALLSDLARERGGAKASIVQKGGISHFIKLLERGTSGAQKHAACALWGLTAEPAHQKAVLRAGAVPLLIKLLSAEQRIQGYAAAALNNLAHDAEARTQLVDGGVVQPATSISEGPETWLRSQAVGILQQLKIEAPQARSMAQEMAMRISTEKAIQAIQLEEKNASPRRRGWDSTYGNPRFDTESNEFDHLLLSPRMIKNSYKQDTHRERPTRFPTIEGPLDSASGPDAPLDFDAPHPNVIAALTKSRAKAEKAAAERAGAEKAAAETAVALAAQPTEAEAETDADATALAVTTTDIAVETGLADTQLDLPEQTLETESHRSENSSHSSRAGKKGKRKKSKRGKPPTKTGSSKSGQASALSGPKAPAEV